MSLEAPKAKISHQIPNRVRIRIPSRRNRRVYFDRVERELGKLDGVDSVRVNPGTGSVLIHHHAPFSDLARYSREKELFDIVQMLGPEAAPWDDLLFRRFERWDANIRSATHQRWDLSSVVTLGLLGVSFFQALRRNILPPAWTLVRDAMEVAGRSRSARQKRAV